MTGLLMTAALAGALLMDELRAIWGFFVACWDVVQVAAVVAVPMLLLGIAVLLPAIVREQAADRKSAAAGRRYAEAQGLRRVGREVPSSESVDRGPADAADDAAAVVDLAERRGRADRGVRG